MQSCHRQTFIGPTSKTWVLATPSVTLQRVFHTCRPSLASGLLTYCGITFGDPKVHWNIQRKKIILETQKDFVVKKNGCVTDE